MPEPDDQVMHERMVRRRVGTALAIFFLSGCLVWYLLHAVGGGPAPVRATCKIHLGQLRNALYEYHEHYGSFPPAYIELNGKPAHSWRVLLLPFLEHMSLYREYRFDEPWNGPHNAQLAIKCPPVYRCPFDEGETLCTSYVAIVGPNTCWPAPGARKLEDITDIKTNTTFTLLLVEIADSGINWMEPRDLKVDEMNMQFNAPGGKAPSSHHPGIYSILLHATTPPQQPPGQATHGIVDKVGAPVMSLPDDLSASDLKALITVNGGEEVQLK